MVSKPPRDEPNVSFEPLKSSREAGYEIHMEVNRFNVRFSTKGQGFDPKHVFSITHRDGESWENFVTLVNYIDQIILKEAETKD